MNCQQIQDLIPLYVGSDLEESRARLVAAHVQRCETCSDLSREYRETRQLIQTVAAPSFTEEFYAEMRQSVWQNLEKKSPRPAFSSLIADLFRPRWVWAATTAVLIAVSAIGIYVIRQRAPVPQPFVSNQPPASQATPNEQRSTSSQRVESPTRASTSNSSNSGRSIVSQPGLRQGRKAIPDRINLPTLSTVAAVSPAATSAPTTSDLRQPGNGSSHTSEVPLRMEIQTKNPNIRIIWLAPGDTKQLSPNSKGT